jgi:hypothetical protein
VADWAQELLQHELGEEEGGRPLWRSAAGGRACPDLAVHGLCMTCQPDPILTHDLNCLPVISHAAVKVVAN